MAEYSEKQLNELAKGIFRDSPHEAVVYAQINGTFLNQVQYDKLVKMVSEEKDEKKKAAGQKHLESIITINNPNSDRAKELQASAEAKKQKAAADKVAEMNAKEEAEATKEKSKDKAAAKKAAAKEKG